ncbi:hypothetical protein OGAPHI_001321 [Ogataea philodendri]|uniref:Zn(2)-C6 fungal-type domain-containing protein n=1 Tax=Ogataea philodendri TaxID=1378263 RepID=A0A9P8T9Z2_9ASCO|nr:uncharacterized protein OGAPHI_001321 [Ogataea philodendri]KAH3670805.1 hypothetical protein OGAPHI_001321 [Ogataea philodendri]
MPNHEVEYDASSTSNPSKSRARRYRSRKERPCDFCRRKREACFKEGINQKCVNCERRNLVCSYNSLPIKKKSKVQVQPTSLNQSQAIHQAAHLPVVGKTQLDVYTTRPEPLAVTRLQLRNRSNLPNSLELHNGQTSVFVGLTGDQDPWLLSQVLNKSEGDAGADTKYEVKNLFNDTKFPIIFAVCPTEYLNPRPDQYCVDNIQRVVEPLAESLINNYFIMVNPSYPIISRSLFLRNLTNQQVSSTLLASIYVISTPFLEGQELQLYLSKDAKGDWHQLNDFILKSLSLEQGAATLQTVQAILLKLNARPLIIRNANAPRHWALSGSLVALGQELGLNIDPSGWDIPSQEKRLRRVLWWAIYVHDKWESIGLSRPSHIHDDDFKVEDIKESDFLEDDETPLGGLGIGANLFVAFVHLSKVLSKVLLEFCSIKHFLNSDRSSEEMVGIAVTLMNRLDAVEAIYFSVEVPDTYIGSLISLHLAKTTCALSCCRSILRSKRDDCYSFLDGCALKYANQLNQYLCTVRNKYLDVHWWCYSRMNFSIVGICILAFYLASKAKGDDDLWKEQVDLYRQNLHILTKSTHVTQLALLRFELLLSKIESGQSARSTESAYTFPEINNFNEAHIWADHVDPNTLMTNDDAFIDWLTVNGVPQSFDNTLAGTINDS